MRRARAVDVSVKTGRGEGRVGGAAARLRRAAPCGSRSCSRRAASRCRPTPTCAATRCRSCREPSIAPARALAFATIRATFEEDAYTERAFREAAERLGGSTAASAPRRSGSPTAPCSAAAPPTRRSSALADRSPRLLDPPVLAALRLGLYELLFADGTPDHAAVDQAVELVKGAGAAHAAGLVNAVLRRAAREREELTAALLGDDSTPERAAVAHSAPLWLARMWWEELGAEAARSLLAACNEPAEVALRVDTLRGDREAMIAALREAGVEAGARRRAAGRWRRRRRSWSTAAPAEASRSWSRPAS